MKNLFLSIACLFVFNGFGQEANKIEVALNKVKERILLIETPTINSEYIEKLKEKGKENEINIYTEKYNAFVSNFKKAFTDYWTIHKDITFKTHEEIQQIIESKTDKYAIIRYSEFNKPYARKHIYTYTEKNSSQLITTRKFESKKPLICLYLSEDLEYTNWILKARMNASESLGSLILTVEQYINTFDYFLNRPNIKKSEYSDTYLYSIHDDKIQIKEIENKTLLVKKEDLDEFIDIDKIAKYYPYNYKIVSNEEWEKAIIEKDEKSAVLVLEDAFSVPYTFYPKIVFTKNGMTAIMYVHNFGITTDVFNYFWKTLKKLSK